MTRVKRGNVSRKRHKKTLKIVKGFRGASSILFRTANQRKMRALSSSYTNRRKKKRDFRSIWITRIHAAVRNNGMSYSEFVNSLKKSSLNLNRKILAQFSLCDPESFLQLVNFTKKQATLV
uniref:Large ribosomal subunit protein bL20c n=1 Tax=Jenufa perforata TaxID=993091 RepID=A0A0S2LNR8_9CHLO|nr:ribosomal protein L20 [Jenufa perforata]ALO62886.1 ribosomal protein L20 [Jenufa perforata]